MSVPPYPPMGSENSYFYTSTPTCDAGTILLPKIGKKLLGILVFEKIQRFKNLKKILPLLENLSSKIGWKPYMNPEKLNPKMEGNSTTPKNCTFTIFLVQIM